MGFYGKMQTSMDFSEDKLQKVTKKIIEDFQPEKIIFFGSRAYGTPRSDSDVDLLVIKDTAQSTRQLACQIDSSIFPRPFPIDLIVYTPKQLAKAQKTGDFFISEIIDRGRVLYAK